MTTMSEKLEAYATAEQACPGMHATAARFRNDLGLYEVFCESKDGREKRVMVTKDGVFAGYGGAKRDPGGREKGPVCRECGAREDVVSRYPNGKVQHSQCRHCSFRYADNEGKTSMFRRRAGRKLTGRDPQKPGKRNLIGRRKTRSTPAGRLISRKSQKAAKRAMFRMGQKSKLLACHACNRTDFATEKSLKLHTAKFHTPGQKSPRGFRTKRDPNHTCERCGRRTEALPNNPKQSLYFENHTGKFVCHGCYGQSDSARKKTGWRSRSTRRLYRGNR